MMQHRVLMRFALRRLRREEPEHAAAIDKALANRDFFSALADEADSSYMSYCEANAGSPLTDFFEWLLEHSDEIIALIIKLLPLFI